MRRKLSLGASLALGTDWELATGYWAFGQSTEQHNDQ